MPRLSSLSVGQYIRNPRGVTIGDGLHANILKIVSDEGDCYKCQPVKSHVSGVDTLDDRHYFIDKSQQVEQASP